MTTYRLTISIFQASLSLLVFWFFSTVIYLKVQSPYNIIMALVVLILGMFVSRFVFLMMTRRGILTTMTGNNASYDLDELEPVQGDGVIKLTAETLQNMNLENNLEFGAYKISIWGDWEGRKLDARHTIKSIDFDVDNRVLSFIFQNDCLLKIKNPSTILFAKTYLKIVNSTEVLWQIPGDNEEIKQYSYLNTGKEIKTKSNSNWSPHSYDLGVGMIAIYMQG